MCNYTTEISSQHFLNVSDIAVRYIYNLHAEMVSRNRDISGPTEDSLSDARSVWGFNLIMIVMIGSVPRLAKGINY